MLAAPAALALALIPVSVEAHAQLIGSDPPAGAMLQAGPAGVRLFFSEPVTVVGRGISVYGPDGKLVTTGNAHASGTVLSVDVDAAHEGTYAVLWTVVSADTHPSRGELSFSVGHASPVHAPGFGRQDVGLVTPLGLFLQAVARWLHFGGYALGFGAGTYAVFFATNRRTLQLAGIGVVLLLAAEPLALLGQTASLDVAQTFDGDSLAGMLASPFGRAAGLRVAAALLLWAVLGALAQAGWLKWAVPAIGGALAVVDGGAAHAIPALPAPFAAILGGVHVSAMGFWVGGLAAFARSPAERFDRPAAWSAGVLILSGAALALLHFGNPGQLLSTAYGLSLLVKLPLVLAALGLAYTGRRRPELVVLGLVLATGSVLVSLPPPR